MKTISLIVLMSVCLTAFHFRAEKITIFDKAKTPEMIRLGQFVGKWITTGTTVGDPQSKSLKIQACDIYEWASGGSFIIHHTISRIGPANIVALEIIGYDNLEKKYKSHFFGQDGSNSINDLKYEQGRWYWQAKGSRGNGIFSADGRQLVAHHEKLDNKGKWIPSMEVILNKVE